MKKKVGKSIGIFSGKGGVGKTTMTLNLAGIYESLGKKVLIMDMDLSSGNVSLALNKPASKTIYNFVDDYNNKMKSKQADGSLLTPQEVIDEINEINVK